MTDKERSAAQTVIVAARKVTRLRRDLADAERVLAMSTAKLERVCKQEEKRHAGEGVNADL